MSGLRFGWRPTQKRACWSGWRCRRKQHPDRRHAWCTRIAPHLTLDKQVAFCQGIAGLAAECVLQLLASGLQQQLQLATEAATAGWGEGQRVAARTGPRTKQQQMNITNRGHFLHNRQRAFSKLLVAACMPWLHKMQ